jgi:hypothetical protein
LVKTLQGILMILPISKAFQALKTRLDCISSTGYSTLEVPLSSYNAKNAQTLFFFGEDYLMKQTKEEAQASKVPALSLEDCLQSFDDSLIQC